MRAACWCVRLALGIQPSHKGGGHCKHGGRLREIGGRGGHAKLERESGWTDMTDDSPGNWKQDFK